MLRLAGCQGAPHEHADAQTQPTPAHATRAMDGDGKLHAASLAERAAAARAACRAATAQTRATEQRLRRAAERANPRRYTAREQFVAVAVLSLTDSNAEQAAEFLRRAVRARRGVCEDAPGALEQQVQTWLLEATPAQLQALADPAPGQQAAWMRCARRFVAEARVTQWVRDQNMTRGLAPPSALVYEQLAAARNEGPAEGAGHAAPAAVRAPGARVQLVARWRRRWRARLGKVRARDDLTQDAARAKAGRGPKRGLPAPLPEPPRSERVRRKKTENWIQKWDHFLGSENARIFS